MFPTLFTIPGTSISIHSFGLMLVVALLAGLEVMKRLARSKRLDPEIFVNVGIIGLVSGVVGARLSHVLENLPVYTDSTRSVWENFRAAINITSGGLTYYGGFILAFVALVTYAVWKKLPLRTGMDIVAPAIVLGLALGRVGCFFNGCCYGAAAELPWSVKFPYGSIAFMDQLEAKQVEVPPVLLEQAPNGAWYPMESDKAFRNPLTREAAIACSANPVHPAQLYSTITGVLLAAVCVAFFYLPHAPGQVMALMMMLEGVSRFLLESVRAEPSIYRFVMGGHEFGWSYSMVIGMFVTGAGMVLWLALGAVSRRPEVFPAPAE